MTNLPHKMSNLPLFIYSRIEFKLEYADRTDLFDTLPSTPDSIQYPQTDQYCCDILWMPSNIRLNMEWNASMYCVSMYIMRGFYSQMSVITPVSQNRL